MAAAGVALGRAALAEFPYRLAGVLEEKLADVPFVPAVAVEELGVLGADNHEGVTHDVHLNVAQGAHGVGKNGQEVPRVGGVVHDVVRRLRREHRHRTVGRGEAQLDVHWLPGVGVLVLGNAVGVGARVAEGGLVGLARYGAAQVEQDQLDRAADGRIGSPTGAEAVVAAVMSSSLTMGR